MGNGEKIRSALDHIYHNNKEVFSNFRTIDNSMSDHIKPILCTIKLIQPKQRIKTSYILRRNWKNYDLKEFKLDLNNQPWQEVIDANKNVHQQAKRFDEILESTLNTHAPLVKSKI